MVLTCTGAYLGIGMSALLRSAANDHAMPHLEVRPCNTLHILMNAANALQSKAGGYVVLSIPHTTRPGECDNAYHLTVLSHKNLMRPLVGRGSLLPFHGRTGLPVVPEQILWCAAL